MTLPDERYRALVEGTKLLHDLTNTQHTPRVPGPIRERARWVLRHYPSRDEMERIAQQATDLLDTKDYYGKQIK